METNPAMRLIVICLIVLLGGCVTTGAQFTPVQHQDPSKALVYFYRPHPPGDIFLSNTYSYAHGADLYLGNEKLVSLSVNAYSYVELEPGSYRFSMRDKLIHQPMATLDIDVVAGQRYYLRYSFRFMPGDEHFFQAMPRIQAEEEIIKTRFNRARELL
jgi:hypothetical protein